MTHFYRRSGVSLIEVIIVIAVVALLVAMLLPAIQRVRVAAHRMTSMHNLKQIQLAVHNFASANGDRLPAIDGDPNGPNPNRSAFVAILPFIEQHAAYDIASAKPSNAPAIQLFLDPADPTLSLGTAQPYFTGPVSPSISAEILNLNRGLSSYAANAQVFRAGYTVTASIPDGHSNTIMVGDSLFGYWGDAYSCCVRVWDDAAHPDLWDTYWQVTPATGVNLQFFSFGSNHGEICVFALADGSTHNVSKKIDQVLFKAISTRNGAMKSMGPSSENIDGAW